MAQEKDSPCNAIVQTNIVRLDDFFISTKESTMLDKSRVMHTWLELALVDPIVSTTAMYSFITI